MELQSGETVPWIYLLVALSDYFIDGLIYQENQKIKVAGVRYLGLIWVAGGGLEGLAVLMRL